MIPEGADTVLVRYGGEIGTKSSPVQRQMEHQLARNIEALLADRDIAGSVERRRTRPLVRTTPAAVTEAAEVTAEAFGVVSTSPARSVDPDLDAITPALAETAQEHYTRGSFAVDARRAGEHAFTSKDIESAGGDAIWSAVEGTFEPTVDLDEPDLVFGVECRQGEAFLYLSSMDGPGGLPLGTQAGVVALISGGIDSPVAAFEIMRRGCPVTPIYLDLGEYGGPDHEARALETIRTLQSLAPNFDLRPYRVPAGSTVAMLADRMERGRMLSLRRYMYQVAEHLADRVGAHGIVTGESIGQKSSQTGRNLAVTSRATSLPVHRPLLTADKDEIVERARAIGTFADSTINAGCNRFAPSHPETNGRLDQLDAHEPTDLFELAERDAARAEPIDLAQPSPTSRPS